MKLTRWRSLLSLQKVDLLQAGEIVESHGLRDLVERPQRFLTNLKDQPPNPNLSKKIELRACASSNSLSYGMTSTYESGSRV